MFCVPKSVQTSQKKIFFASGAGKARKQSELETGIWSNRCQIEFWVDSCKEKNEKKKWDLVVEFLMNPNELSQNSENNSNEEKLWRFSKIQNFEFTKPKKCSSKKFEKFRNSRLKRTPQICQQCWHFQIIFRKFQKFFQI